MDQTIINAIRSVIPNTQVRCFLTTGGWVIEAVNPAFGNLADAERDVVQALGNGLPPNQPVMLVWKIFVYGNAEERFSVSGTLHVRESEYDDEGVQTTFLEANDCYVNLTELDAEILQLGDYNNLRFNVQEVMSEDGVRPLMPYQEVQYLWLEALGGAYYLEAQNPTTLLNNAHPALIQVCLRGS